MNVKERKKERKKGERYKERKKERKKLRAFVLFLKLWASYSVKFRKAA
jgi:hypothetical protein